MGSFRIRDKMTESSHLRLMGKRSSGSLFSEAGPVPWQGRRMGFLRRAPVVTCDVCRGRRVGPVSGTHGHWQVDASGAGVG